MKIKDTRVEVAHNPYLFLVQNKKWVPTQTVDDYLKNAGKILNENTSSDRQMQFEVSNIFGEGIKLLVEHGNFAIMKAALRQGNAPAINSMLKYNGYNVAKLDRDTFVDAIKNIDTHEVNEAFASDIKDNRNMHFSGCSM